MSDTNSLTMDKPVEHSLLDKGAQQIIGKPLDRIDGPKKVTGTATYGAEFHPEGCTHGFLVRAPFACGKLIGIDADAAKAMPGVVDVVVDTDRFARNPAQGGETDAPTQGVSKVAYFGEPLAVVVAESFEQARDAAQAVKVDFMAEPGRYDFEQYRDQTDVPPDGAAPATHSQGDLDQAMRDAAATIDAVWTTPSQNSAAMEPHVTLAQWDGDKLTVHGSYQMVAFQQQSLADALGLEREQVHMISPFIGGGFGSKLGISPECLAAAIAAKQVGRPVKIVMTRQNVFDCTVRRSNTRQHIRLAADKDGRLSGIGHDTLCSNLDGEDFFEPAGLATHFLYGGASREINHELVRLNRVLSGSMRAPGEAVGMLALECAVDELADALGIDPVELRKRNDPDKDPEKDIPYSSRKFTQCLDEGAAKFGWDKRNPTPGAVRDGEWLVGIGMAAAARGNMLTPCEAKVSIAPDGAVTVATDMTDIGTGTYTVLAQVAGEMLGVPADKVTVRLGDSDDPHGPGSGGSWGASSSGSAVYLACEALREKLAGAMNCDVGDLTLKDGQAICANRSVAVESLIGDGMEALGKVEPGENEETHRQASYGAHFAEVAVNAVTGEVRLRRMLGVFAAGRILNEKTARSQCLGGMTFGIGAALTEELVHDVHNGKLVNHDLAEYHVPVNADVPQLEVIFLEERDPYANPLQSKGIGELGISGAGAAIANAVYNATGRRVRDYPLTLDKLLDGLPEI